MPGWGQQLPDDAEGQDQAAATLPVTQGMRLGEAFGHFDPTQTVVNALREDFSPDVDTGIPETDVEQQIDSESANHQYGVPGYLRFNGPVVPADAAFQQHMALQRQFRDQVMTRSTPSPLTDFGAGLAGALVDPTNLGLAALTGGSGDAALGAFGLGEAADGAAAITRVGRLAEAAQGVPRALAVGAIENAPLVGANAYLSNLAGDDYDLGDGLRDLAAGAVLHTAIHASLKAAGALSRGVNPDGLSEGDALAAARGATGMPPELAAPASGPEIGPGVGVEAEPRPRADLMGSTALTPYVPEPVDALPPAARYAAWRLALEAGISDEPVHVGELVARELAAPSLARLDESSALYDLPSYRPGEADMAVTTRGTEIPVRYGLAELGDLVTSHTDDLQPNPAYPPELQPRNRARAGAIARNLQLEAELNPKLLMSDVGAGQGAPIVSPGGVVESGNGRTIALRRAAAKGAAQYAAYRAELEARGYDTSGMQAPALVRMRTEPLTGGQRSALAHEMNADVTERMSATEQAQADAARLPPQLFDAIEEGRSPTTSRAFARGFIDRVAPDQVGAMTTPDGRLSPDGARRIKAAVLQSAYGDARLTGQIFEDEAGAPRRMAEALADAAPGWAKLRALVARGEVPAALDLTPALASAMDFVRAAAERGIKVGDILRDELGQLELFGGEAVSPATEALLRLVYRDEGFSRPMAAEKIAAALKDYARQASEAKPGPDLFGETADATTARTILANLADRFRRGDASSGGAELDTLRPPGPSSAAEPAGPVVIDLREPGGERGGRPGGVSPEGGERPGEPAADGEPAEPGEPGNEAGSGARGQSGQSIIAADSELKALAADTARLAAANGLELADDPAENPDTVAKALRAAAVCLAEEM